jgi:proline racemase
MTHFSHIISAIDSHTAGEPTRVVLSGLPPIQGQTMADKMAYVRDHMDHLRRALMHEPRGHQDMFGAILTAPCHPEADRGLMYMDGGGYLTMCGHGTIGTAVLLVEMGLAEAKEPETVIVFDKGELQIGEPFVHESIIGTLFNGQLLRQVKVGDLDAVVPRVGSTAYITGIQQFVIDPEDPLAMGFSFTSLDPS